MLPRKARSAAGVVICSEWGRGVLETRLGPRSIAHIAVVHHGLDLDEWAYIPREKRNEPPVIVAVGRLTPKKGFDHLIDACRLLRDRGLDFRCEIIGPDGGLGASLDRAIIAFSLEACVRLLGATPPAETRSRIAGADLLACPSIRTDSGSSDGIPNVVLEAMALGTPVVATDAGGIPEVVLPGETGYRVPQRDPGALAAALAAALADEPGRRRMAAAARARVESAFDVRRTTRDFLGAIGVERPAESKPALRETATG
jgi:glycosyltransferase involved in cell wall biosynthesis